MAQKIIVLSDSDIKFLMTNSALWNDFPCFKTLTYRLSSAEQTTPAKTCGRCGSRMVAGNKVADVYREARNCIVSSSASKRAVIKSTLKADQIRVFVKDATGTVRQCTF